MLVMGMIRESRQDLSKKVGMMSRVQEALEDLRMAVFTSSGIAGEKLVMQGGTRGGSIWGEEFWQGWKAEQSLATFWSKNFRNVAASEEYEIALGRTAGALRDNREFKVDQSFLGWVEQREIALR